MNARICLNAKVAVKRIFSEVSQYNFLNVDMYFIGMILSMQCVRVILYVGELMSWKWVNELSHSNEKLALVL
jgi:hypothetical protein